MYVQFAIIFNIGKYVCTKALFIHLICYFFLDMLFLRLFINIYNLYNVTKSIVRKTINLQKRMNELKKYFHCHCGHI